LVEILWEGYQVFYTFKLFEASKPNFTESIYLKQKRRISEILEANQSQKSINYKSVDLTELKYIA
jgi:hypothetical protein